MYRIITNKKINNLSLTMLAITFVFLIIYNYMYLSTPEIHYNKTILAHVFLLLSILTITANKYLPIKPKQCIKEFLHFFIPVASATLLIKALYDLINTIQFSSDYWDPTSNDYVWIMPSHNSSGFLFGALTALIAIQHLKNKSNLFINIITMLLIFCGALLVIASGSRAAFVATFTTLGLVMNKDYKTFLIVSLITTLFLIAKNEVLDKAVIIAIAASTTLAFFTQAPFRSMINVIFLLLCVFVSNIANEKYEDDRTATINQYVNGLRSIPIQNFYNNSTRNSADTQELRNHNVSTRLQIWSLILNNNSLKEFVFGNINFECDTQLRFIAHVAETPKNYECDMLFLPVFDKTHDIFQSAHNAVLYVYAKYGAIGIVIFAITVLNIFYHSRNNVESMALLSFVFIYGIGTNGFFSLIGSATMFCIALLSTINSYDRFEE